MNKLLISVLAAGALVAAAAPGALAQSRAAMRTIDATAYKWESFAKGTPLTFTPLWGPPYKGGEFGMLLKLPAGFKAGLHSHTQSYNAINVQGNWVHTGASGQPSQPLAQGSFVFQPGKVDHDDFCPGPQDCIIFVHMRGKDDFIPGKK